MTGSRGDPPSPASGAKLLCLLHVAASASTPGRQQRPRLNQESTETLFTPDTQLGQTELHPDQPKPKPLGLAERVGNLLAVTLPLAGLAIAGVFLWGYGFSWVHLGLLLGMYILTGLGITIGYHRLFTHKAFEARLPVKAALAVLGSMAVEGPLLKWVAVHRRHHQHSDEHDDPHSPNVFGGGLLGVLKGLWHAHLGWIFKSDPPQLSQYVPDLQKTMPVNFFQIDFKPCSQTLNNHNRPRVE